MNVRKTAYQVQLEALQRESESDVAEHITHRRAITRTQYDEDEGSTDSFGQRAADAVARFGGSWTFIGLFALVLLVWVLLNSYLLMRGGHTPFDPFPYILLNLFLSMLASLQAPVILMSQNRQGEKDRVDARNDYEINLKAELEIMALHDKIDSLKVKQWEELIVMQQDQIKMLTRLCRSQAGLTTLPE
jgi:uncharacterized membrane protein